MAGYTVPVAPSSITARQPKRPTTALRDSVARIGLGEFELHLNIEFRNPGRTRRRHVAV
jgi:hypothetical protein